MNTIKEYNTAKKQKGNVQYGAVHGGRWTFRCSDKESGPIEKILKVPGGKEIADKIALVISKSWKRTAGKGKEAFERLDVPCRNAIDRLCQIRTLKDWTGEPEWWTNALVAEGDESVPMVFVNRPTNGYLVVGISAEDLDAEIGQALAMEEAVS